MHKCKVLTNNLIGPNSVLDKLDDDSYYVSGKSPERPQTFELLLL
jgi:hypothetical protein